MVEPIIEDGTLKVKAGRYALPVQVKAIKGRYVFKFGYNKKLIDWIKTLKGRTWHPETKQWTAPINRRNNFSINAARGVNVFKDYDQPIQEYTPIRDVLLTHQRDMVAKALTYRHLVIAGEMGTGKSLAFIETADIAKKWWDVPSEDIWYVGPVAGVKAVSRELRKWKAGFNPRMMTYNKMVSLIKNWGNGRAPRIIMFDESSCLKTESTQRSSVAMFIAEAMRDEYGRECIIFEASGTPAPNNPTDIWHQSEVACPGFLKEASATDLKYRLAKIEQRERMTGGIYPHMVCWWEDENLCAACGQPKDHPDHMFEAGTPKYHLWKPSVNEVAKLYKRLKGLVHPYWKKDCTDLPDKQYVVEYIKPTPELIRAAKLIKSTATNTLSGILLSRELADGFQYTEEIVGEKECNNCAGKGEVETYVHKYAEEDESIKPDLNVKAEDYELRIIQCPACTGTCKLPVYRRSTNAISSPKDEQLKLDLEDCEETGRAVVWAAFQGTIDRLTDMCVDWGWTVLRIDGRGYHAFGACEDSDTLLSCMDRSDPNFKELRRKYPKVVVVGNPDAGGMALTFTAANMAIYYSNTNNGQSRMQSEDRIHRVGMDENKAPIIKDYIILPSCLVVYNRLKSKKRLQDMTLGEMNQALQEAERELRDAS